MCHDAYCLMFLLIFSLSLLLHIGVLFHQSWFHVWPAPVFVVRADNLSCPIATLWKDKKISFILPKDRSQVAIDTAMVNNIWRQTRKFGKTFPCTYCTIKWSYSLRVVIVTSSRVLRDTLQTTIFFKGPKPSKSVSWKFSIALRLSLMFASSFASGRPLVSSRNPKLGFNFRN